MLWNVYIDNTIVLHYDELAITLWISNHMPSKMRDKLIIHSQMFHLGMDKYF